MKSQEIRALAPEMDPLRLGMGWSVDDLSKPQILVESTFGDSHRAARICSGSQRAHARGLPLPAARARATLRPTSATGRRRATMGSTFRSRRATRLQT